MTVKLIRQGDVLLVEVSQLPKGLKEKDKTIAFGEATGHHHRFETEQVQVFVDGSEQQFVQVKKPSKLIHEEHQELEIPKGNFKVVLQREFDVLNDSVRKVMD